MEKPKISWNVRPQMVVVAVEEEEANCLFHLLMEITIEIFHSELKSEKMCNVVQTRIFFYFFQMWLIVQPLVQIHYLL